MKPIIEENNLIISHQFGFREKHSTIDQVHSICTSTTNKKIHKKKRIRNVTGECIGTSSVPAVHL